MKTFQMTIILSILSKIREHCLMANAALGGDDPAELEVSLLCIEALVRAIRVEMQR